MIEAYEWTEETAPWPDYVGGYYKMPNELPAMQAFCYAEGTAAAYKLALAAGRTEEAAFFEKHTRETVRFGLQMQLDPLSTYGFTRPAQVEGGIRYAMNEPKVRIDYVHHALSAMYQWYQGAAEDPALPEAVRTGPMLTQQRLRLEQEALKRAEAKLAETPLPYDPVVAYTGMTWPVPMANVAKLAPDQKSEGQ